MAYDEHEADTAALGQLADELTGRGYEARLTPDARRPLLAVRNPAAPMLAENVTAHAQWFWWPWADRIAEVTDVAGAAERVVRVLAVESEPSR